MPLEKALDGYRKGAAFLLTHQNTDGSWGGAGSTTGFDVRASVPGAHQAFKMATTALCVMALTREALASTEAAASRERGLAFILERSADVKRPEPDELYNVWAHGYAIQALAEELRAMAGRPAVPEGRATALRVCLSRHLDRLARYETTWGGWGYYDFRYQTRQPSYEPPSFTTATILVAFHEAERAGVAIPPALKKRALRLLEKCRKSDGSFLYSYGHRHRPMGVGSRIKGSLGRSQSCNLALFLHGRGVTAKDLKKSLDDLFAEHRFIEIGRKRQYPHEAWYNTAGYYYYYGHYYAARVIEQLPPEERPAYRAKLAAFILPHQESNGTWWDFRLFSYHWAYGTALALLTLDRCL